MTVYIWKELAEAVRWRTDNWKNVGSNAAALTISFKGSYPKYIVIRKINTYNFQFTNICTMQAVLVGPCHHGMARPQVADRGTASDKEGSCE